MHFIIFSETFKILLQKLLGLFGFLLFGPFLAVILMFLYIYRRLVEIVLKIQLRNKFAGLLESSDAVWSVEDISLSLVTVVIILKKPAGSTNTFFLKNVRKRFNHLSKTIPTELEKLFYYRYEKYGYFYWVKHKFNPETAIRWLECEISNCDGSCEDVHSTTFQENLGFISNKQLYDNHKPMWEMLIGRRCRKSTVYNEKDPSLSPEDRFNTDLDEIPLVFRFHHSFCDGVAFFKFLDKVIFDEGIIKKQSSIMNFKNDTSTAKENSFKKKQIIFPKIKIASNVKQIYHTSKEITRKIIHYIIIILFDLEIHVSQYFRCTEKSVLRQPLTGEKLICLCMENDADTSQLLMKIKKLKRCTGARFNDIIITAFAAGLRRYYSRIKEILSDKMSIGIPIRMSKSDEKIVLTNDFSGLLIHCCFVDTDRKDILTLNKNVQFFERLQKTALTNNKIRNSLDASVNYFNIKHIFGLVPARILKLFSTYMCTMVYSNIDGIKRGSHFLKHPVSNMIFLIPHRNTTGLGLTVLTYKNKLNLALIVDKAVIGDIKLIREIMEETVREINFAYNSLA